MLNKYLLMFFCMSVFLCSCWTGEGWAVVTISPAFVEVSLDKGQPAGQFVIANTGDEEERYRIQSAHFIFTETGDLLMLPADENSLAQWIKFNPKEISIPPKSNRKVRFVIVRQKKLEDREYWGAMELESLRPNISKSQDASGRSLKLTVSSSILVPIFAQNGKPSFAVTVNHLKLIPDQQGTKIECNLSNTGTAHLKIAGKYKIIDGQGKTVNEGDLGTDSIMPGYQRTFFNLIQSGIPPGEYTVQVTYNGDKLKEPLNYQIKHLF